MPRFGCACQATAICHAKSVGFCSHLDSFPLPAPQTSKEACTQALLWLFPQPHITPNGMPRSRALALSYKGLSKWHTQTSKGTPQQPEPLAGPASVCSLRRGTWQTQARLSRPWFAALSGCRAGSGAARGSVQGTEGEDTLSSAETKPGLASSTALVTQPSAFSRSHSDSRSSGLRGAR